MVRLETDQFGAVLPRYLKEPAFFPLIAAVIERTQDGTILVDNAERPRQVYVEHAFGFAQVFGEAVEQFEADLEDHFSKCADFPVEKVRLYTPLVPDFLEKPEFQSYRSQRQRFVLINSVARELVLADAPRPSPVEMKDVDELQERFGVVTRFWRSADQFTSFSQAIVVRVAGTIATVCYAAAIGGRRAEIDIVTDPAYRRRGLGRQAVTGFVASCVEAGLEPVWDCFTNNIPSVRTARSLGFSPKGEPYVFFTIPRA